CVLLDCCYHVSVLSVCACARLGFGSWFLSKSVEWLGIAGSLIVGLKAREPGETEHRLAGTLPNGMSNQVEQLRLQGVGHIDAGCVRIYLPVAIEYGRGPPDTQARPLRSSSAPAAQFESV